MKEKLKQFLRDEKISTYNNNEVVYYTEMGEDDLIDKIISILIEENRDQKIKDLGI